MQPLGALISSGFKIILPFGVQASPPGWHFFLTRLMMAQYCTS